MGRCLHRVATDDDPVVAVELRVREVRHPVRAHALRELERLRLHLLTDLLLLSRRGVGINDWQAFWAAWNLGEFGSRSLPGFTLIWSPKPPPAWLCGSGKSVIPWARMHWE